MLSNVTSKWTDVRCYIIHVELIEQKKFHIKAAKFFTESKDAIVYGKIIV